MANFMGGSAPAMATQIADGFIRVSSATLKGYGPGDLDADRILDVAVVNGDANTFSVLLTFSDGSLRTPQDFAVGGGPSSVALSDFSGDGPGRRRGGEFPGQSPLRPDQRQSEGPQ